MESVNEQESVNETEPASSTEVEVGEEVKPEVEAPAAAVEEAAVEAPAAAAPAEEEVSAAPAVEVAVVAESEASSSGGGAAGPAGAGGEIVVHFRHVALGISIEADAVGDVRVAEVFATSTAFGRVAVGDRMTRVEDDPCPRTRDEGIWDAFVDGIRSRPRPVRITFEAGRGGQGGAGGALASAGAGEERLERPRRKRERDDLDDLDDDPELRLALQASKRAAVVAERAAASEADSSEAGRPSGPKSESTQKRYWRKRVDEDLAPRNAKLQFVWPNPKAHLTSKSGKKTAAAYEAYCTATCCDEFFAKGGRADELAYDFARGFVAIADDGAELRREARAGLLGLVDAAQGAEGAPPPLPGPLGDEGDPAASAFEPPAPAPPRSLWASPVSADPRAAGQRVVAVGAVGTAGYPEHKNKAHATAELANYLVMKGGTRDLVADWNVAKNQRGDTIFIDPVSGRIFRSKPEVARYLGLTSGKK